MPVSRTSLKYFVELPKTFTFKEALEITGLSRSMLLYYVNGDWTEGKLIKKEGTGKTVFYEKLIDLSDPVELSEKLLSDGEVYLFGRDL